MSLTCAISKQTPDESIVAPLSRAVQEKRLISKYIKEYGKDPITNEPLGENELSEIDKSTQRLENLQWEFRFDKPPINSFTSISCQLRDDWDTCMLNSFELRQCLTDTRQELSHAFSQLDSSFQVIVRLRKQIEELQSQLRRQIEEPLKPQIDQREEPIARYSFRCKLYERTRKSNGAFDALFIGSGQLYVEATESPAELRVIVKRESDVRRVFLDEIVTSNIALTKMIKAIQMSFPSLQGGNKLYVCKLKNEEDVVQLLNLLNSVKYVPTTTDCSTDGAPKQLIYLDSAKEVEETRLDDTQNKLVITTDILEGDTVEIVEDHGVLYSILCKFYERVRKSDGGTTLLLRGYGQLYVKNTDSPTRLQVVVRQEPVLERVMLDEVVTTNTLLKQMPKAIQMCFSSLQGENKQYVCKFKNEKNAKELLELLNSVKNVP